MFKTMYLVRQFLPDNRVRNSPRIQKRRNRKFELDESILTMTRNSRKRIVTPSHASVGVVDIQFVGSYGTTRIFHISDQIRAINFRNVVTPLRVSFLMTDLSLTCCTEPKTSSGPFGKILRKNRGREISIGGRNPEQTGRETVF